MIFHVIVAEIQNFVSYSSTGMVEQFGFSGGGNSSPHFFTLAKVF